MVVPQPPRGSTRTVAFAFILLMLASALPLQGAAQLVEANPNWLLKLHQGEGLVVNGAGKQIWFIDNATQGGEVKVQTRVYNYGTQEIRGVPVYFWIANRTADPNLSVFPVRCVSVDVPAGRPDAQNRSITPSFSPLVYWNFSSVLMPPGGHEIAIRVNEAPDPSMSRYAPYNCPSQQHGTLAGQNPELVVDPPSANHTITAYFVKDFVLDLAIDSTEASSGIRWCMAPNDDGPCDENMETSAYPYIHNRTFHAQRPQASSTSTFEPNPDVGSTYLQVHVKNIGNLTDVVDYGSACKCKGFPFDVRVTASGFGLGQNKNISWTSANPHTNASWITVGYLPMREMAGIYHVNVSLDPPTSGSSRGLIPEMAPDGEQNNVAGRMLDVQWVDYAASIDAEDFRTNATAAYAYSNAFKITGDVEFRNLGNAPILHPESTVGTPPSIEARIPYRVEIIGTNFSEEGVIRPALGSDPEGNYFTYLKFTVEFNATSIPGDAGYIRPGKHKLIAMIDEGDLSFERNESNNLAELDIYVADSTPPTIVKQLRITEYGESSQGAALTSARPNQALGLHATVEDDDRGSLTVVARFTLEGDPSIQRNYTMAPSTAISPDFFGSVFNLTFVGNGSVQNWTYVLDVTDAFGNPVTGVVQRLMLERYPIQSVGADRIVRQYEDGKRFNYSDEDEIAYRIYLTENGETGTGVFNQTNVTSNLFLWLESPNGESFNHSDKWRKLTDCPQRVATPKADDVTSTTYICNAADPELFSTFQNVLSRPILRADPGLWNVSIRIVDDAGETRYVNRTLFLADASPILIAQDVLQRDVASVWRQARSASNSETVWVTAEFTDDRTDPMTAFVNLTRSDGRSMNFSLAPRASFDVKNETTSVVTHHFTFNSSYTVGQARNFSMGGDLNLTIEARDSSGNWVKGPVIPFKVNDTQVPTLIGATATPSTQEVGHNVTLSVRATDETNVTALVSIQNGDVDILPPTPMETTDGYNFTYVTSIAVEGNYAWTIAVRDSMGQVSQETGTLAIRDNLGPRYEIQSPSNAIGAALFGPALPRIELVAFDSDNVDPTSIVLVVDGQPVVPEVGPPPAGMTGLTLTYQVPASRRFFHGEEVVVNVSTSDGSAKHLPSWLNFTFRVDDIPPTARLSSFTPQFRDGPSQDWNVSLETVFRLEAEDDDNLPTDVASIRYRILVAGGNSGENVYTGPFRIRDVPGVYRGPTTYQIQYWAEDSAGNVNTTRLSTRVYVDDAPPDLVQYFPQGYYVNATLVDDRVGVARAVVWHRVNAEPYRALSLEPAGNNLWQGVIPEARKGDRVSYYLQAWDQLDNTLTFGNASEPRVSFAATNHNPAIRITGPVTGSRVSGNFNLDWTASDEDGDALTFLVSVKSPGKTGYTELAKLDTPDTRRYPVDSRRYLDGEHVFRVSANDGGVVKHSEVTLRILNRADPLVSVSPVTGDVVPGSTVLLKAEVAKAEAVVEARLYLDGVLVGSYAMNDEGREGDEVAKDGVYSVRAPVDASGDYSVEIFTRYEEDGEMKSSSRMDAISFSSRMTPGYVLREYAVILVLIAVAAAIAIGVAAWGVMRKRR